MFMPDKLLAATEARRVLKPGGLFLFNVWDALEHNALGQLTHCVITGYFEKDPPTFYQIPFGYHDQEEIKRVLAEAGFYEIKTDVVSRVSQSERAEDAATGLVHGNPVAVSIVERDASLLPVITNAVAIEIAARFGERDVRAPMRAIVVQARA